jgi:hypothetical protein
MDREFYHWKGKAVHQNKKVTIVAAAVAAVGLGIAGQAASAAPPPSPIVARDLACEVPAGCVSGSEIVDHSVGPQDLSFTVATGGDLAAETAARIAGDDAANSARIAGDDAANSARASGDTATNQRITDLAAPASGSGDTVHWSRVTGVPADLADGDDGVTFAHIHVVSTLAQLTSAATSVVGTAAAPELILVEPGTYDIGGARLPVRSFVTLAGSGRGATKIVSHPAYGQQVAVLLGTGATVRDLSIDAGQVTPVDPDQQSGHRVFAIYAAGPASVERVAVRSETGPGSYLAVGVATNADVTLRDTDLTVVGGTDAIGVAVNAGATTVNGGSVDVTDSTAIAYGFQVPGGTTAVVRGSVVTVQGTGALLPFPTFDTGVARIGSTETDAMPFALAGTTCASSYDHDLMDLGHDCTAGASFAARARAPQELDARPVG